MCDLQHGGDPCTRFGKVLGGTIIRVREQDAPSCGNFDWGYDDNDNDNELDELVVEIDDPRRLTTAEHGAILERCGRANMAIYVGKTGDDPDKAIPVALGAAFGLHRLDQNRGADDDAVTSLTVQTDAAHRDYIRALMHPACMTIPASHVDGEQVRPDQSGPVFSVRADGCLHMRYTNRARNIVWRDDPVTTGAVAVIKDIILERAVDRFVIHVSV